MYLKSGLKTEAVCVFYIENVIKILIGTHNEKKKILAEPKKFASGIYFGFRERRFWT